MKILLKSTNCMSVLKALENKILMFHAHGRLMMMSDLKFEAITETTGKGWFKTTRMNYYLVGAGFKSYNDQLERVCYFDEEQIGYILRNFDLGELRKKFKEFELQYKALKELEQ